jgi:hypothetical protein
MKTPENQTNGNGQQFQIKNFDDVEKIAQKITLDDAVQNMKRLVDRAVKAGLFSMTEEVVFYGKCVHLLEKSAEELRQLRAEPKTISRES